jgi:hypothetical protein
VFLGTFVYGQRENPFFSQKTNREGGILIEEMKRERFLPLLRHPKENIIVAGKVEFAIKKARQFFALPRFNYQYDIRH